MITNTLKKIITKYKPLGIRYSNEFLMSPEIALGLVGDLAENNIMIVGCDLWRYIDRENKEKGIVTLIGAGKGIDDFDKLSPAQTAEAIQTFLQGQLPSDAELVSLLLIDLDIDRLLTE